MGIKVAVKRPIALLMSVLLAYSLLGNVSYAVADEETPKSDTEIIEENVSGLDEEDGTGETEQVADEEKPESSKDE